MSIAISHLTSFFYLQMDAVENAVISINSIAEVRRTNYSSVNVDWVLDIDSYYSRQLFDTSLICGPCVTLSSSSISNPTIPWSIFGSSHSATTLTTEHIIFHGCLDHSILSRILDDILYGQKSAESSHVQSAAAARIDISENTHSTIASTDIIDINAATATTSNTAASIFRVEYQDQKQHALVSGSMSGPVVPNSMSIYRMKGIVHIQDSPYLHILQAVHDTFELYPSTHIVGSLEDRTNGNNLFVVIGKALNKDLLASQLMLAKVVVVPSSEC